MFLNKKIRKSKEIIQSAYTRFKPKIAVFFVGDKDSTVLLHIIHDLFDGWVPMKVMFINTNEGSLKVLDRLMADWNLDLIIVKDRSLIGKCRNAKDKKKVLLSMIDTGAMKQTVKEHDWRALMIGIKWDEYPEENYLSTRNDCVLVHPILHFSNRDILHYIRWFNVPHILPSKEDTAKETEPLSKKEKMELEERLRRLGYI